MESKKKINFLKAPYKGVFSEVARELMITPQAVRQAVIKHKNARMILLVNQKIAERKHAISRFEKLVG